MPIIKKSFGKNYLQCYESEKGKTYSCEQIRKSWDNKVNYVTENSLKNTKEEAQKEFVDAFILRLLSEKKLWKIAHANIVDSAGNITDGRAMLDKLSSPLVLENINTILKNNPVLLKHGRPLHWKIFWGRELIVDSAMFLLRDRLLRKNLMSLFLKNTEARCHMLLFSLLEIK